MNLIALPALSDNSIWMFRDDRQATVVDPGESAPVFTAVAASHLTLAAILVTHREPTLSNLRFARHAASDGLAAVPAALQQRQNAS